MKDQLELIGEEFLRSLRLNGLKFDKRYRAIVWESSIELVMVTEDNKRIFGSEIELTNYGYEEVEFKIGKGSMGPFDNSCEASMSSYIFMGQIAFDFSMVKAKALSAMKEVKELRKSL